MLSVDGFQVTSTANGVGSATGWKLPGGVGAWVSVGVLTRRRSRLGPPVAVVAVARILLVPMATGAVTVFVAQVSQLVVAGNDTAVVTVLPLTAMSIGRSTVVPLAYRNASVALPAADALTVNSTEP